HPGDGWPVDKEFRECAQEHLVARKSRRVAGQTVRLEWHLFSASTRPGEICVADTERTQKARYPPYRGHGNRRADFQKGCEQHHAPHAVCELRSRQKSNQRSGGMGKEGVRRGTVWQNHLAKEQVEIGDIFIEVMHMPAHRI